MSINPNAIAIMWFFTLCWLTAVLRSPDIKWVVGTVIVAFLYTVLAVWSAPRKL